MKPTTPQGNASSTAPSGVPMLPQLPSPGQMSLPAPTLSGAGGGGGNTLTTASLMHQGSGLAHQGSFSSQQQMHSMAQAQVGTRLASELHVSTPSIRPEPTPSVASILCSAHRKRPYVLSICMAACIRQEGCVQQIVLHSCTGLNLWWLSRSKTSLHVQMQQPSTAASHQETHVYTQSSETLKAHANVLKVGHCPTARIRLI